MELWAGWLINSSVSESYGLGSPGQPASSLGVWFRDSVLTTRPGEVAGPRSSPGSLLCGTYVCEGSTHITSLLLKSIPPGSVPIGAEISSYGFRGTQTSGPGQPLPWAAP